MQYGWDYFEESTGKKQVTSISRPYIDHFRKFYCDTATQGHEPALLEMAYRFSAVTESSSVPMPPWTPRVEGHLPWMPRQA